MAYMERMPDNLPCLFPVDGDGNAILCIPQ